MWRWAVAALLALLALRTCACVVPIGPFCPFASPGLMNLCSEPRQRLSPQK